MSQTRTLAQKLASTQTRLTPRRTRLTPQQYNICFLKGTEPPFSGKYTNHHEAGMYVCVNCGADLFTSETKFVSHSGWPSFYDVISKANVKTAMDLTHGMWRTEVMCSRCGSHLGHLFTDGPHDKTGLHYCINSLALDFKPRS